MPRPTSPRHASPARPQASPMKAAWVSEVWKCGGVTSAMAWPTRSAARHNARLSTQPRVPTYEEGQF
eukprot:359982-Chlamydomonas_euryale.AAC.4